MNERAARRVGRVRMTAEQARRSRLAAERVAKPEPLVAPMAPREAIAVARALVAAARDRQEMRDQQRPAR